MDQALFLRILQSAVQAQASDIHLQSGSPPGIRVKGELMNIKVPPLSDADMLAILGMVVSDPKDRERLKGTSDFDCSFDVKGLARFRVNILKHRGHWGAVLRVISMAVPNLDQLNMPPVLKKIASFERGLVLVTGATGSGKSSTLAAMIDYINSNFPVHILSIEDPIEFVHTPKKARITQREVGKDTKSFADALRAALRQDPDVILVGEMRDTETIDIALKAAETGHLVFSTVHTTDAIKTIGRLIATFPSDAQTMVRLRLADNLVSTISQRLVPRADGKGLIAVQEIMVTNAGIEECIADPKRTGSMNDFIAKSHNAQGMGGQTFDQHLVALYRKKILTLETAMAASNNPADFERNLMFGSDGMKDDMDDETKFKISQMSSVSLVLDREEPVEEPTAENSIETNENTSEITQVISPVDLAKKLELDTLPQKTSTPKPPPSFPKKKAG